MKKLVKAIGIFYFITGAILLSMRMHDKTQEIKLGLFEYFLSPLFLVVRLFISTITTNTEFLLIVIGVMNIIVVWLVQKYYMKSGFLLKLIP